MPLAERRAIVGSLRDVDATFNFNDDDGSSRDAIIQVRQGYPTATIVFANGGDRTSDNIPEMDLVGSKLEFVFGVGGEDKANSSSWILDEWKAPKTVRDWGYYRVLHEVAGCKVKELTIMPGQGISMQKHHCRNEYWLVSEGACHYHGMLENGYALPTKILEKHNNAYALVGYWHQLVNPYDVPCRIVEIQYGTDCVEDDIKRQ